MAYVRLGLIERLHYCAEVLIFNASLHFFEMKNFVLRDCGYFM